MSVVNSILRGLFDALLFPFRGLPAAWGLALLALVTAVAMLLVYKRASDQQGLEAVKRKIHASLFEIRLFNDDFGAILRAQLDILRHNLTYLRLSFKPMLFILPPLVLVMAQLQFHYGYAGMAAGERTIVDVVMAEGWAEGGAVAASAAGKPAVTLAVPAGVVVETPAVWVAAERTLSWRLRVEAPGDYEIGVHAAGNAGRADSTLGAGGAAGAAGEDGASASGERLATKRFQTAGGVLRRSPLRPDRSFLEQLIYPAEPPLPAASVVEQIRVALPPATVNLLGWNVHEWAGMPAWMIVYVLLSIVFAFALRKPFGVQI